MLLCILMGMSILMGVGLALGKAVAAALAKKLLGTWFSIPSLSNLNLLLGLQYVNPVKFESYLHNSHLTSDGRKSVSLN